MKIDNVFSQKMKIKNEVIHNLWIKCGKLKINCGKNVENL